MWPEQPHSSLGHYQHHLPADLGYYDLPLPEVRQQQADFASQYGIHGSAQCRFLLADSPRNRLQLSEPLALLLEDLAFFK